MGKKKDKRSSSSSSSSSESSSSKKNKKKKKQTKKKVLKKKELKKKSKKDSRKKNNKASIKLVESTKRKRSKLKDGSSSLESALDDSGCEAELKANMKQIAIASGAAFRDAKRPFGMELDGALVCDMADGCAALVSGVQIGWRVVSVDRKVVPEQDEGVAAKILREAEDRAAAALDRDKRPIMVTFHTEDPEHWKLALARLKRYR